MRTALLRALDARARAGNPACLWWRDDDAVEPSGPLDRLLHLAEEYEAPVTLAVIPEPTGSALAQRLAGLSGVSVAVHGWSHRNHAPKGEKQQELGAHRPVGVIFDELAQGAARLRELHQTRFVPVLVPPWNRIAPSVVEGLPAIGFKAISTFGPAKPAPLRTINTHVDLIDWRGTRGGRPSEILFNDIAGALHQPELGAIGLLSHHLVNDAQAWSFLAQVFELTRDHPGCRWVGITELLAAPLRSNPELGDGRIPQ
jgi:peptidoglycan/xylan/chitin deacetylase (PgdA/CDA1 family)